ncbi:hypothetical protein OJAV_G00228670 [Oryzias javanicus]|uniref:Uncharacterized protein n=1 Tax=Oryzias javanicus TaxID=123683 RepID=A0A3S2MBD0_ORYJA|nr:hypothetical protein OJAV_G00228670 [Oryzias javanicus]
MSACLRCRLGCLDAEGGFPDQQQHRAAPRRAAVIISVNNERVLFTRRCRSGCRAHVSPSGVFVLRRRLLGAEQTAFLRVFCIPRVGVSLRILKRGSDSPDDRRSEEKEEGRCLQTHAGLLSPG